MIHDEHTAEEVLAAAKVWLGYGRDPKAFFKDVLNIKPDFWQGYVAEAFADPGIQEVHISSSHGPGKTFLAAALSLWAGGTLFARVPCVAPKMGTLRERLWPEIAGLIRNAAPEFKQILEWQATKVTFMEEPGWVIIAETARDPESLQGHHREPIIAIIEEASGVRDEFWPVIRGWLTTPGSKLFTISNPTRATGEFARTHDDARLRTKLFRVGFDLKDRDPNKVKHERTRRGLPITAFHSSRIGEAWALDMIDKYGVDSNVVRVRVLGLFPKADDDSLVSSDMVFDAYGREPVPTEDLEVWTWDVAGSGRDLSYVSRRAGYHINFMRPHPQINLHNAAVEIGLAMKHDQPGDVNIDVVGIGTGPVDTLTAKGFNVNAVNFGASPVGGDPEFIKEKTEFANLRAECYWKLRRDFHSANMSINPRVPKAEVELLAQELEATKWKTTPTGKIQMIPKDMIKAAIGRSPDRADACAMYYARTGSQWSADTDEMDSETCESYE